MKHDDSIQGVLIQSVLRHCGGRVRFRLCRTVVALIPIIPIILGASSCRKETPPQPYVRSIELEALDASCTEAWLRVRFTDSAAPRAFALKRDGQTILSALSSPLDTLVVDEGLLPNRTYTYKAYRLEGQTPNPSDSTQPVQLTTMDTTSHNFTWQIDTLGDGGGSVLYDVAIINDTLAYAVGEIYKRDSLGNWDPQAYNMVRWNGSTWQLMRIQFYTICGQPSRTPYPAKSIFAFSANDIWIAMDGDQVARWNGTTQTATMCLPVSFSINKLWGENPNSVYAVGWGGNIMHYDGVRWRRIESGTTLPIWDIYGARDDASNDYEIICVASNHNFPEGRKLLNIQGLTVTALADSGLPWSIDAMWHVPGRKYVVVGDGVYYTNRLGPTWRLMPDLPYLYTTSIAGSAFNDVIIGGAFWNLLHFNGLTLHSYFSFASGSFTSVAIKENTLIAVGGAGGRAIAVRGTR